MEIDNEAVAMLAKFREVLQDVTVSVETDDDTIEAELGKACEHVDKALLAAEQEHAQQMGD
jgi:hypothetical protein